MSLSAEAVFDNEALLMALVLKLPQQQQKIASHFQR